MPRKPDLTIIGKNCTAKHERAVHTARYPFIYSFPFCLII